MIEKNKSVEKMGDATKWSLFTEIGAKIIHPLTNAVLARLLMPEVFGAVATINMVVSFTDIFTDAGFQKFIVQHEFKDNEEKNETINVAFWSNLILSMVLFSILVIFRNSIAEWTGASKLGMGIAIAALNLPITSFSSIEMAVFRREMDFRSLFFVRIIGSIVPLVVTIPLAFSMRSYWALILGTLCGNLLTSIMLTVRSSWKPQLGYSFKRFRQMFSFCYWILIESIFVWITSYIGTFIVGRYFSDYYLGLYKTSITTVNQIMGLITSAMSPVIFSVISRLQNDRKQMCDLFLHTLKRMSLIMIPLGFGTYLYSDLVTNIFLGAQWTEAIKFIGLWGLCNAFGIILASFWDGMFNAIGKPVYSVLTQILYLIILIPFILIGSNMGYEMLCLFRCLSRIAYILVQLIAVWCIFRINLLKSLRPVIPATLCSIPMCLAAITMKKFSTLMFAELIQVFICVVIYGITVLTVPETREEALMLLRKVNKTYIRKEKEK